MTNILSSFNVLAKEEDKQEEEEDHKQGNNLTTEQQTQKKRKKRPQITHVVEKHDTLQGLALKYNVSKEEIRKANKILGDNIFLHKTLIIPPEK